MKNHYHYVIIFMLSFLLLESCDSKKEKEINKQKISLEAKVKISLTIKSNAPALQSFAHGVSGSDWLLFAGRTNSKDSIDGGIHNLLASGNYTSTSFPRISFNDSIYVYNIEADSRIAISIQQLISSVTENSSLPRLVTALKNNLSVFKNTNALVRQVGDYLYVVGGYGSKKYIVPKDSINLNQNYITYKQVAKINVTSMIKIVQGKRLSTSDWKNLMSFGENTNLVSTGGELYHLGDTFYLVTGHNFTTNSQKYVDAVYPFSINTNATNPYLLDISVNTPITDVSNPKAISADKHSIFRRRDGPITPAIYKNPQTGFLEAGISIYTGVFKHGFPLKAWNDAIYVHPSWKAKNNKEYTYDTAYNQKNFNVYSCPSFVGFDEKNKVVHTYLLGGIGDGKGAPPGQLSGFTNTGMHITMFPESSPLQSSNRLLNYNMFGNTSSFYGAEAILFPNQNLVSSTYSNEIIDLNKSFKKLLKTGSREIKIGYIFGGIEAFEPNPGTFGKGKSQASNKIWKVTLTKN